MKISNDIQFETVPQQHNNECQASENKMFEAQFSSSQFQVNLSIHIHTLGASVGQYMYMHNV